MSTACCRAGLLEGGDHPLCLGTTADIPYLKRQTRLTFARCGITDPLSLEDYRNHGGLAGLTNAVAMTPEAIVQQVTESGLRGRGGAGFPDRHQVEDGAGGRRGSENTSSAMRTEGDSGTFADRMIMEGDPFVLIEGMAIAGIATGATKGYLYTRSEYPHAIRMITRAIEIARKNKILGPSVLGSGHAFDMEVREGAGAYVCGEETALLESLEGRRGVVRAKPPLPAHKGFSRPPDGGQQRHFARLGADHHGPGRRSLSRFRHGPLARHDSRADRRQRQRMAGLFEAAFGMTLGDLVDDIGGGTASGRPVKAVQVGGPLGAYFPREMFDTPFDYEAFTAKGGLIGHAGNRRLRRHRRHAQAGALRL